MKNKINKEWGCVILQSFLLAEETFHDLLIFSVDSCSLFLLVHIIQRAFHLSMWAMRRSAKFWLIHIHLRLPNVDYSLLALLPWQCPLNWKLILQLHLWLGQMMNEMLSLLLRGLHLGGNRCRNGRVTIFLGVRQDSWGDSIELRDLQTRGGV